MTEELFIRKLEVRDISAVAELHHKSFRNFFLTSLGIPFLKEFYQGILSSDKGLGLGIFCKEELLGFAVGSFNNERFYTKLLKANGLNMLIRALPQLLAAPSKIKQLSVSLLSARKNMYGTAPCLLSICTNRSSSHKGLGSRLIQAFELELLQSGHGEVTLTTDRHQNEYVNDFYCRNDYICVESYFQGKREMNFYYKQLKI